jgi:hypothetical protein
MYVSKCDCENALAPDACYLRTHAWCGRFSMLSNGLPDLAQAPRNIPTSLILSIGSHQSELRMQKTPFCEREISSFKMFTDTQFIGTLIQAMRMEFTPDEYARICLIDKMTDLISAIKSDSISSTVSAPVSFTA